MWVSVSATIQGTSHIKSQTPCQDYTAFGVSANTAVIVLADGAGSAKHSRVGAQIACNAILSYFFENFDKAVKSEAKEIRTKLVHRIRTRLGMAAKKVESTKEEYASTLLFVAIKDGIFICGHLGDGVVGYIDNKNISHVLSLPDRGEYANFTYFTTSKNYQSHFRLYKENLNDIKAFFLMSDGAADCLFQKNTKQFAKAVTLFSNWVEKFDIGEVQRALEENMKKMFPQYTTDDCSFNLLQRSTNKLLNSKTELI